MKSILVIIFIIAIAAIGYASDPHNGGSSKSQEVRPKVIDVSKLPPPPIFRDSWNTHERGALPEDRVRDYLLSNSIPQTDVNTDGPSLYLKSWQGPNMNGWQPADADIAAGPLYVMVVTNEQYHIYARDANLSLMSTNTLQTFFNRAGKSIFDPKVVYDPWRGRWLMLALEKDGLSSYYWLAVSQTSNPTGQWWIYQLNAHVDGSTTTQNWADYPGLGFSAYSSSDSNAIFITTNQYNQAGSFQYAKVRVLSGKQIYAGQSAGWWDFWNMTDANTNKSFTIKPSAQWNSTSYGTEYLINTYGGSNNFFTVWRIDKPLWWFTGGVSITRQSTITVDAYSVSTPCKQPGGVTVDAFDCRTQDVIMMVGKNTSSVNKFYLYTALPSKYVWSAADTNAIIRYYKLNVSDNSVDVQGGFGGAGFWYTFPKPAPVYNSNLVGDSVIIAFIRGGSTVYNETRVVSHDRTGFSSSYLVTAGGTGHYGNFRFGDYSGACIDNAQNGRVWVVTMRNKPSGWGTGIGYVSTNPISGITSNNDIIPETYSLGQNYPNPFNPSTTISYDVSEGTFVTLKIYNTLGVEVATLVNTYQKAGIYKVDYDAANLSSGVYYYKLTAGNFSQTRKMLLVK